MAEIEYTYGPVSAILSFDVHCMSCGASLTTRYEPTTATLMVEPCDMCLDAEREAANERAEQRSRYR